MLPAGVIVPSRDNAQIARAGHAVSGYGAGAPGRSRAAEHGVIDGLHWTGGRTRAALAVALIGVPLLAMSAKAGVVAWYAAQSTVAAPAPAAGYEREDHFPGAALLYADMVSSDTDAAPGAGSTGTAALPDLPIPANADLSADLDGTVRPARPFVMNAVSAEDRGRALSCLATAIYYEAASESDDGQRAVAQVILNRVRHPAFPATVCGVVYQGSEKAGCQFSFACDGAMARVPSQQAMLRATRVAAAALAGYVFAPVGLATHYHTYAVTPAWNRSLVMTDAIGAHFFHRWKGYWGTAAAFSNTRYHGGEPVPGPHPRMLDLPGAATGPTAIAMTAPIMVAPASAIQPKYSDAGAARTAPVSDPGDRLPPAGTVLDRWKDSGQPLR